MLHATVDRFWKIEFAFWQSWCNGEAEKSVQDAILAALPTVDRAVTLIDACRKLSDLEASKLVIFCGAAMKTIVKTVRGYISTMQVGIPPDVSKMGFS